MTVGFRPTQEDNKLIEAHRRPDESTADVLRRALRALDRERWEQQAREDMDRIAASGEDLSDEPDAWSYDEDGETIDRSPAEAAGAVANDGSGALYWLTEEDSDPTLRPRSAFFVVEPKTRFKLEGEKLRKVLEDLPLFPGRFGREHSQWHTAMAHAMAQATEPLRNIMVVPNLGCTLDFGKVATPAEFEDAIERLSLHANVTTGDESKHPTPPKLARLRATAARARRANQR